MNKIFLNDIPKINGFGKNSYKLINDWSKSIGYKVNFIYDNINGQIEIINYIKEKQEINIRYLQNEYIIKTSDFINCKLGKITGIVNYDFKFNEDEIIKTNIGEIKILSKYKNNKNKKCYRYQCLKCLNIDNIIESDLIRGKGCNVCCPTPRKVLIGYNDIATTASFMIDWLVDKNDAFKYTYGSANKILFKCKECNNIKLMKICDFYERGICCNKCGDGVSYPNKIAFNLLSQLNLSFESEKYFDWCVFNKYKNKDKQQQGIYDFYFEWNGDKYIIEMDGAFHFKDNALNNLKYEEVKYIDNIKDNLAKEHDIEVIRINCEKSDLEYIKENILNSNLKNIVNLSTINWDLCDKYATSSRIKEVCNIWNSGVDNVSAINKLTKISNPTIVSYLKKGTKLGWGNYNSKVELAKRSAKNNIKNLSKRVKCLNNGYIFSSASECERLSEKILGVKLFQSNISLSCRKGYFYRGFKFEYI